MIRTCAPILGLPSNIITRDRIFRLFRFPVYSRENFSIFKLYSIISSRKKMKQIHGTGVVVVYHVTIVAFWTWVVEEILAFLVVGTIID